MTTETTNPVRDLLMRARQRIEQPEHWTRNALARTADQSLCNPWDLDAISRCAIGALRAEYASDVLNQTLQRAWDLLNCCARKAGYGDAASLNDTAEHAHVLALYDRAIALAEAQQ